MQTWKGRRKPALIETIRFDPMDAYAMAAIGKWLKQHGAKVKSRELLGTDRMEHTLHTPHGPAELHEGDYIVRECTDASLFYVVNPYAMQHTHEQMERWDTLPQSDWSQRNQEHLIEVRTHADTSQTERLLFTRRDKANQLRSGKVYAYLNGYQVGELSLGQDGCWYYQDVCMGVLQRKMPEGRRYLECQDGLDMVAKAYADMPCTIEVEHRWRREVAP